MNPVVVDQSHYAVLRLQGPDRAGFLHRITTANLESLSPGQHAFTCLLSPKGRVMSVFDVYARETDWLLIMEPVLAETTQSLLGKYAMLDNVEVHADRAKLHRVWQSPQDVWTAPPIFRAAPSLSSEAEVQARRIEAGFPAYGSDVSADHFPFESDLQRFIDHKKGCYIGQEPVARVRDRGEPQKFLRGLRMDSDRPPSPGTDVLFGGQTVGRVTSSVRSPDFGAIALSYIGRAALVPGTIVDVSGQSATVHALPFGG
jgi:folate-binding protein YgfZ